MDDIVKALDVLALQEEGPVCTVDICGLGYKIEGPPRWMDKQQHAHYREFHSKVLIIDFLGVEMTFSRRKDGDVKGLTCICGEIFRYASELARHIEFDIASSEFGCKRVDEVVLDEWEKMVTGDGKRIDGYADEQADKCADDDVDDDYAVGVTRVPN
ncbi:hypothetical protein BGX30_009139, partial [Mortierella sp. GBA39]